MQLPLPFLPHVLRATTKGWTLEGANDDGPPNATLQLSRVRTGDKSKVALEPADLPSFARIERRISLGLGAGWEVETRLTRMTPLGRSIFVALPLLEGESVTTERIRIEDGRALVSLGSTVRESSWAAPKDRTDTKAGSSRSTG